MLKAVVSDHQRTLKLEHDWKAIQAELFLEHELAIECQCNGKLRDKLEEVVRSTFEANEHCFPYAESCES